MERYKIYSLALALSLSAVACQKDFDETLPEGAAQGGTQITLTVDPSATRVDVDGYDVSWSAGDQVMFFNGGSGNVTDGDLIAATISEGDSKIATFTGSVTPSSGTLYGFYPASGAHINNGNLYLSSMLRLVQPLYLELSYDADGAITPSSLAPYCYMLVKSNEELSSTGMNNLTGTMEHLMAYVDLDLSIPSGKKLERVFIALTSTTTTLPIQSMKISAADGSVTYDQYVDNMATVDVGDAWHLMDYMVLELTGSDGNLGTSVNADGVVPVRIPFIPQTLADTWTIFATYTDGTESIQKSAISNTLEAGKVYTREIDLQITSGVTTTPKLGDYYYSDGTYSTNLDASKTVDGLVTRLYVNGVDTNISQVASPYAKYSTFMEDAYTSSYTQWNPLATGNAASGQNAAVADIITTVARIKTLVDASNAYYADIDMDMTYLEILEKVFPGSHAFAFALNSNTDDGSPDYTTYSPNGTTLAADNENIWHLGSVQDYMAIANDLAMLQGGKGKNYFFKQEAGYPASVTSNENYVTLFPLDSDGDDTYDRVTLYAGKQTTTTKTDALLATIMALETTMDSGRKYGASSINNTGKPTCTYANTYYKANSLGKYTRSSGDAIYTTVTGQQVTHVYPTLEDLYFRPIKRVNYEKSSGSGDIYATSLTVTIDDAVTSLAVGKDLALSASAKSNVSDAAAECAWEITAGGDYATLSGSTLTGTAEGTVTVKVTATYGGVTATDTIDIVVANQYTVSFNLDADTTIESVLVDANATVSAPSVTNYTVELFTDADYTTPYETTTVITADRTIYVKLTWDDTLSSYKIATAEELVNFRNSVNGGRSTINGTLTDDIDLSTVCSTTLGSWMPIGSDGLGTFTVLYQGTFDGANYTISNLYVYQAFSSLGFFGDLGGATIKNLTFDNAVVKVNGTFNRIGVVAGYVYSGTNTISNCHTTGTSVVTGNANLGGLIGTAANTNILTIENCKSNTAITGAAGSCGGIIGSCVGTSTNPVKITNCSNTGAIVGENTNVGGIGGTVTYTTIESTYNAGTVTASGKNSVGGVFGSTSTGVKMYLCYNDTTGTVTGAGNIGGVVGQNGTSGSTIVGCYNAGEIVATGSAGGVIGNLATASTLVACYNTGKVAGGNTGGIAGNNANFAASISYCYNTGAISGTGTVGSIVGGKQSAKFFGCYWVTGTATSAIGADNGSVSSDFVNVSSIENLNGAVGTMNENFSGEKYPYMYVAGTSTTPPTVVAGTYVAPTDSDAIGGSATAGDIGTTTVTWE
ncbi:MAG: hypothetical protein R3Y68_02740 [Rikenellaceae bacterium]